MLRTTGDRLSSQSARPSPTTDQPCPPKGRNVALHQPWHHEARREAHLLILFRQVQNAQLHHVGPAVQMETHYRERHASLYFAACETQPVDLSWFWSIFFLPGFLAPGFPGAQVQGKETRRPAIPKASATSLRELTTSQHKMVGAQSGRAWWGGSTGDFSVDRSFPQFPVLVCTSTWGWVKSGWSMQLDQRQSLGRLVSWCHGPPPNPCTELVDPRQLVGGCRPCHFQHALQPNEKTPGVHRCSLGFVRVSWPGELLELVV